MAAVTLLGPIAEAVSRLRRDLAGCRAEWVIGGSVAAALHGAEMGQDDVDVETGVEGASEVFELVGGVVTRPLEDSGTALVRSRFGARLLGSVTVEVIGGLRIKQSGDGWTAPLDIAAVRTWVDFAGEPLPVLTVAALHDRYVLLRRPARVELLRPLLGGTR